MNQDIEIQQTPQQQVPKKYANPPHIPWPTSKPGPLATQPPPGERPMPGRTEQMVEIGYNQETGTPSTDSPLRTLPDASQGPAGFDQPTAQQAMKRRKRK
ncbi:MAG: hypothetical protein M3Z24_10155 [Chloroflexota bacterium]|nr:hypothetical protein [Chloroflexota bacterium]